MMKATGADYVEFEYDESMSAMTCIDLLPVIEGISRTATMSTVLKRR
jgi:hypothetical protein